MGNYANPQAFKACYAQFEKSDNDRNTLFTQLLECYDALRSDNARVHEQLQNEKETSMMWQDNARSYKKELNQIRLATVSCLHLVFLTS